MGKIEIKNLVAEVENKKVLKGLSLTINTGEVHAIMGPNGAGKSSLCNVLMGHPKYKVLSGEILLDGENIIDLAVDERAKRGLFLSFQNPVEIPALSYVSFLKQARNAKLSYENPHANMVDTMMVFDSLRKTNERLNISEDLISRNVNVGFSGGEKKKAEIMQMATLKPKFAFLDEIDSGLDVDSLGEVSSAINKIYSENEMGMLMVTHYNRLLSGIVPDYIHILIDGVIVKSGDALIAHMIEEKGYDFFKK